MDDYRYLSEGHAPNPSTLFGVTAGWLAFIAVAMGASLSNPTGVGDPVLAVLTTAGAAVGAVAFGLLALRLRRDEETNVWPRVPAQIDQIRPLPRRKERLDRAA